MPHRLVPLISLSLSATTTRSSPSSDRQLTRATTGSSEAPPHHVVVAGWPSPNVTQPHCRPCPTTADLPAPIPVKPPPSLHSVPIARARHAIMAEKHAPGSHVDSRYN
ncbi:hypothetical protein E2562_005970 [Oryza meyeriana var. granulata]|uniref:Uncharacterized protein n=1 Tax=Oryza meyeriana var. granulata TaxID=110450 RepID=A0A6G1DU55_9ORYZ|nr:hypothetical protein E2562_005970 [Oryza meyeriana var. granulata]